MDFFFEPRGIALIGATENPAKGGANLLENLRRGFQGPIYPVNAKYSEIQGLPCFPSVADVPDPVDLAIIFIPAAAVPGAVRDCARRGIPGVMVQSGGFAEIGAAGLRLQQSLAEAVRETGIRVWGPNCMGLFDGRRKYVFSFMSPGVWDRGVKEGPLSLVVQSGMLAAGFLIDLMTHTVMGVNKACSIGNKVDVAECELLEYLMADDTTGAVAMYLESISDGRRFYEICRRSAKPLVLLKGGISAGGARAAMSHTASLAGDHGVTGGALAQAGVIEARDFHQLMELGQTLALCRGIGGTARGQVAVLTFSGGAGIVSADFIESGGLSLAGLGDAALETLRTVFPPWMPPTNPVDLWPAVERSGPVRAFGAAMDAVCGDPGVEAVFAHLFVAPNAPTPNLGKMAASCRAAGKPLFCWLLGDRPSLQPLWDQAREHGVPAFREIHRAVEAIAAVFQRRRFEQARSGITVGTDRGPEDGTGDV